MGVVGERSAAESAMVWRRRRAVGGVGERSAVGLAGSWLAKPSEAGLKMFFLASRVMDAGITCKKVRQKILYELNSLAVVIKKGPNETLITSSQVRTNI